MGSRDVIWVSLAWACSCIVSPPITVQMLDHTYGYQGRVVRTERDDSTARTRLTIHVRHVWKGDVGSEITAWLTAGNSCSARAYLGDEIAFATDAVEPSLMVCAGHAQIAANTVLGGLGPPSVSYPVPWGPVDDFELALETCDVAALEMGRKAGIRHVDFRALARCEPAAIGPFISYSRGSSHKTFPPGVVEHAPASTLVALVAAHPEAGRGMLDWAVEADRADVVAALVPTVTLSAEVLHTVPTDRAMLEVVLDNFEISPESRRQQLYQLLARVLAGDLLSTAERDESVALLIARGASAFDVGMSHAALLRLAAMKGVSQPLVLAMLRAVPESHRADAQREVLRGAAEGGRIALFDQVWSELDEPYERPERLASFACAGGLPMVEHLRAELSVRPGNRCLSLAVRGAHADVIRAVGPTLASEVVESSWGEAWRLGNGEVIAALYALERRPVLPEHAFGALRAGSPAATLFALEAGLDPNKRLLEKRPLTHLVEGATWRAKGTPLHVAHILLDAGADPRALSEASITMLPPSQQALRELLRSARDGN